MIVVTLPYPPSVNAYWRHVSKGPLAGRVLISAEGRSYRDAVLRAVDPMKLDMRLKVEIEATMPDRRKRDLDNLPKAVLDALTHAEVWGDDGQIDDLRIVRATVKAPGGLVVRIWPLGMAVGEQVDLLSADA
jgi:crossover junction endodeoxyribonuclease RusA